MQMWRTRSSSRPRGRSTKIREHGDGARLMGQTTMTREMGYETITLTPMIGALGAEVSGIDLRRPLAEKTVAEIRHAFLAHQLLLFRDQDITIDQQKAFG